jgi:TonB family protein
MTRLPCGVLSISVLLASATPIAAQPAAAPISVTASLNDVALAQWSARVEQNLQYHMRPRPYPRMVDREEGLVEVSFTFSGAGKPDRVTIVRSSGSARLDRAAITSIGRLTALLPMAEGMMPNQQVRAQMLYLNANKTRSDRHLERREAALRQAAGERNGRFAAEAPAAAGDVIMLAAAR